jgi:hypothetical protein
MRNRILTAVTGVTLLQAEKAEEILGKDRVPQ